MDEKIDITFQKAFDRLSSLKESIIAPDLMLKLYAYYKQAVVGDNFTHNSEPDVRNAFKFNAWMQLKGMSQNDAKVEYVKLVNSILNKNSKIES